MTVATTGISAFLAAFATAIVPGGATLSQTLQAERVRFASGESGTTVSGQLSGYGEAGYLLGARAGQTMSVTMTADNGSANFNIFAPGDRPGDTTALFSSAVEGRVFDGILPASGDYFVQVFLMRNAARRAERAEFDLVLRVEDPLPEDADGP